MEKSSQFRAVVRAAFPVHSLQVRFDGVEAEAHAACDLRAGASLGGEPRRPPPCAAENNPVFW